MAEKNGMHFWRGVSSHLSAVVVTGAVSWFSFGGGIDRTEAEKIADHAATDVVESTSFREQVSKQIATESLYVKDKTSIEVKFEFIQEALTRIESRLGNREQ